MPGRLIIPVISEEEALLNPPMDGELVMVRETGKVYKGNGIVTVDEMAEVNAFEVILGATPDATPLSLITVTIPDFCIGILEVRMHAHDGSSALNGVKLIGFSKPGSTLTIDGSTDVMPDTGPLAATWAPSVVSENISIDVTGIAATDIAWKAYYKITTLAVTPP